jgi:hypothetical protein
VPHRLIADFRRAHGRSPTGVETIRLRQQATLASRPAKTHRSLEQMTATWQTRAARVIGDDPVAWVSTLRNRNDMSLVRAHDLAESMLADAAQAVLNSVAERRATFSRSNLLDDAHRLLHGVRFAARDQRGATAERIADIAIEQSLKRDCCVGSAWGRVRESVCSGARSRGCGQFVEGRRDQKVTVSRLDAEFIVATTQVLQEGMAPEDHPGGRVGLQSTHWPQPRFESAVVALDPVVGVPLGVVEGGGEELGDDVRQDGGQVGHHLVRRRMRAQRGGEEPAGVAGGLGMASTMVLASGDWPT